MIVETTRPAARETVAALPKKLQSEFAPTYDVECPDPTEGENGLRVDVWLRRGAAEGLDVTLFWREGRVEARIDHGSRFEDRTLAAFILPFFLLGFGFAVWVGVNTDWIPNDPEAEEFFLVILAVPTLIIAAVSGAVGLYLSKAIAALFFRRALQANEQAAQRVKALIESA